MNPSRRTAGWWTLRALALLAVVVIVFVVLYVWPDSRIIVGPETTYLTEPLDEHGNVDYLAAINQRAAQGVTPDNNAAVLYWQALGPGRINEEHRVEFFRQLGMKPLPAEGEYFQSLYELQERLDDQEKYALQNRFGDEYEAMESRHLRRERRREAMEHAPWTLDDDPELACWLDENQRSIDMFITGTRRAQHFVPTVVAPHDPDDDRLSMPVMEAEMFLHEYMEMAVTLRMRAMLHSGSGRDEKAWQDILACLRLANHMQSTSLAVAAMVSYSYVRIAASGVATVLHEGNFTADELHQMQLQFQDLATCASAAQAFDLGDRLMTLDVIQGMARYGRPYRNRGLRGGVDWNEVLREANRSYDAMVAAMNREMNGEASASDTEAFEEEQLAALDEEDPWLFVAYPFSRQTRTRHMTRTMVGLLYPSFASMTADERRCKARLRRLEMVFAVSLFRAENGQYPASLSELVPTFLDKVPIDPMNDQPMHYRKQGEGYLLWSVGRNGHNDDGRTVDDWEDLEDANGDDYWDDDAFRVPRRQKAK